MSFWIGKDGKIRKIWDNVSVKGHAADVLKTLEQDSAE